MSANYKGFNGDGGSAVKNEQQRRQDERDAAEQRESLDADIDAERKAAALRYQAAIDAENARFASLRRRLRFGRKYQPSLGELRLMRLHQARAAYERRRAQR